MAKIYVVQQVTYVDWNITDVCVFSDAGRQRKQAVQAIEEQAVEDWEYLVDPNHPSPTDKFPGLKERGNTFCLEFNVADRTEWTIFETELADH